MASPNVAIKEVDLSTRIPSFPGVYGGIVIAAKKGVVNQPVLITSETQFLKRFTPNEKVEVGYDNAYFSALAFLQKSNKLWVVRAANNPRFGGVLYRNTGNTLGAVVAVNGVNESGGETEDATLTYTGTISHIPIVSGTFSLVVGTTPQITFIDAGDGTLSAGALGVDGTGTIDYITGDWSITLVANPAGVFPISVSYSVSLVNPESWVFTPDELFLITGSSPGTWENAITVNVFTTDSKLTKEPNAQFLIKVWKENVLMEEFLVSRVQGAKDGYGRNIYIEDALLASDYIRAYDNTSVASTFLPENDFDPISLSGGSDGGTVGDSQLVVALNTMANPNSTPLTLVLDGGHTTSTYQVAIDTLCKTRMDCFGILSIPYADEAASDYITAIQTYRETTLNLNSSYSAIYSPHVKIYDKFNDRFLFVSPDGYAAAAISETASNYEMWYPPAGFRRGMINVLDLRRRYTKGEMDLLYDMGVNPLRFAPGRGILIWGQKTLLTRPSALDRINVRMLLLVIEPAISNSLEDFIFELNDDATRAIVSSIINSYMENIKSRRGVYDFSVVCDATNNTPEDIDNHRLNVWLFIKPIMSVEFIQFTVVITRTGIDFSLAAQSVGAA